MKLVMCALLSCCCHLINGQIDEITFNNQDLQEVFKTLEKQSEYIFNYDPTLLDGYQYSGTVSIDKIQEYISKILYRSPFAYEQNENTIIIYLSVPETYRLCGTLIESVSKEPLIYANVFADDTNIGVQTDDSGFFDFEITSKKGQTITLSYVGYKSKTYVVQDFIKGDCQEYMLALDDEMWNQEIIVTDYILDGITEGAKYSGYSLDYSKLSKYHSNVEHDILKTAQLMPGITSLDESATNLQIRGSSPGQNLILWEGATLYHSGHLFGMVSAINPFTVDEVNIYKGAYDPKYDNRVGGIVDISLRDSLSSEFHGSTGSTLTEAHLNLELPVIPNKLSLVMSGRHSINSIYDSPPLTNYTQRVLQFSKIDDQAEDAKEGFINANQILKFHDWNMKVLYNPFDNVRLKAGIYRNYHQFEYQLSFPDDPFLASDKILVQTDAINASLDWQPSKKWISTLSFLHSNYNNTYKFVEKEGELITTDYDQFNDISDQSLSITNNYSYSNQLEFSAGYDYNVKKVNFNLNGSYLFDPDYSNSSIDKGTFHNIFASANYNNNNWSTNGGLRTTYYVENDIWAISPRMNVQLSVNKQLKIKAEAGIFHQFISQLKEYGGNEIDVDNPLWIIDPQTSESSQQARKMAVGFIYHHNGWLIDWETYHNRTEGLNTLSPLISTLSDGGFSSGSSKAYGMDILVKKKWASFNIWLNYSLGKITYLFPEVSENPFLAPNDIRHIGNIVSSYHYKKWHYSLNWKYHSGLPYSEPIGIYNFQDEESQITYYEVDIVDLNNERLRDYLRLDLSITYAPKFIKWDNIRSEFSLSIINLLNRDNVFDREYYIENEGNLETQQLAFINKALLNRTPLLLLRFHW